MSSALLILLLKAKVKNYKIHEAMFDTEKNVKEIKIKKINNRKKEKKRFKINNSFHLLTHMNRLNNLFITNSNYILFSFVFFMENNFL